MVRDKITKKQLEIMEFIKGYTDQYPYCPNIREIGEAANITSTSVVNYHLEPLYLRGYIDSKKTDADQAAPNTIHLTEKGKQFLKNDRR